MVHESPTLELERELAAQGYGLIVGFDEVGRGALAGPVMVGAAAVRACDLPELAVPDGVADSKMLTERRRETLFEPLQAWCAASAVGQASNSEIDEWGISHALGIAALRALNAVERQLGLMSPVSSAGDGRAVSSAQMRRRCGSGRFSTGPTITSPKRSTPSTRRMCRFRRTSSPGQGRPPLRHGGRGGRHRQGD